LYVDSTNLSLGDRVPVRLRLPDDYGQTSVWLRVSHDGDPLKIEAKLDRHGAGETWFTAEMPIDNPLVSYRWLIEHPGGYRWLTGRGVFDRDVSDIGDFRTSTYGAAPAWAKASVGYQIFPDRFAASGHEHGTLPAWAVPAQWDDEPHPPGMASTTQYFGGDLDGIRKHLDHLDRLGVNLIYLTPFFPAQSVHRYNADRFDMVDPLLGGDAALASLIAAAHDRGIRVIGDLTTNHTGESHQWFQQALADRSSDQASYYYWSDSVDIDFERWSQAVNGSLNPGRQVFNGHPVNYVSWLGVPSLPKLNWGSPALAEAMLTGPASVTGRYLNQPFNMDGWRVDVAHMTGRFATDDYYQLVARAMRATVDQSAGLLVGEHFYDLYNDLTGDGWMSVMNYASFIKPVWSWLAPHDSALRFADLPLPIPRRTGGSVVATMRDFDGSVPWKVFSRQWNMLGSHDTARIASIIGDRGLTEIAAVWLMTYPGIPAIFAGDEGGAVGLSGEASRSTMPWNQIDAGGGERWQQDVFTRYQQLIRLRRSQDALQDGSLRWVLVADDVLAYLRQTADQSILVLLARSAWPGVILPGWLCPSGQPELLYGGQLVDTPAIQVDRQHVTIGATSGPAVAVWQL
jgi:alpha-glucosidase